MNERFFYGLMKALIRQQVEFDLSRRLKTAKLPPPEDYWLYAYHGVVGDFPKGSLSERQMFILERLLEHLIADSESAAIRFTELDPPENLEQAEIVREERWAQVERRLRDLFGDPE